MRGSSNSVSMKHVAHVGRQAATCPPAASSSLRVGIAEGDLRNLRTALLYSIVILVAVATGTAYIHNAAAFWFTIGLIVVITGVGACTLEPVCSRIFHHRQQSSRAEELLDSSRRSLIERWRTMVTVIHAASRATGNEKTVWDLLEADRDFLSLLPHLTARTREAISRRITIVSPDHSTMYGTLCSILDDIDRLERRWGLRDAPKPQRL